MKQDGLMLVMMINLLLILFLLSHSFSSFLSFSSSGLSIPPPFSSYLSLPSVSTVSHVVSCSKRRHVTN